MTIATQNDESDLLILSDDTDVETLNEKPLVDDEIKENNDLISFDLDSNDNNGGLDLSSMSGATEEPKVEVKEEAWLDMWLDLTWGIKEATEEPKIEVKEEAWLDMWLDLTWGIEEATEEPKAEVKEEAWLDMWLDMWLDLTWGIEEATEEPKAEVKEEVWLDLSEENHINKEQSIVSENTNEEIVEVFSLEKATEVFVLQLESRKEQIASDISDDEKIISIKEEKIKNLRSEIADYKKSIKELNEEDSEIDNKISLVTWKNKVAEIKNTTTTKIHNVKRKKA